MPAKPAWPPSCPASAPVRGASGQDVWLDSVLPSAGRFRTLPRNVLNLIHDRPYEMRTEPSRLTWSNGRGWTLLSRWRPAIPQYDLNSLRTPRAGHIDCVAGRPRYVCLIMLEQASSTARTIRVGLLLNIPSVRRTGIPRRERQRETWDLRQSGYESCNLPSVS